MKYKAIRIVGLLLLVQGLAIIILQLTAGEKSVIGSIAGGAPTVTISTVLIGLSFMLERKRALSDQSDTPK